VRRHRLPVLIVGAVAAVLIGGGIASAFWTTGGSGSGSARAGTTVPIDVVQVTALTALAPGGAPQVISGTFTNANVGPVYVTAVTASIVAVTKAAGAPAGTCTAADFLLTGPAMAVGAHVGAGAAQGSWTGATITFRETDLNQDACKGATVTLGYAVS